MSNSKKKQRRKWRIPLIVIGGLLAVLILSRLLFPAPPAANAAPTAANIRTASATYGSVTTAVSGSGVLISADAEDITIPAGVKIDTVFVSAGDQVRQGDLLATVDRNSVLTALADVQSRLDDLDEQLKDKSGDKVSANVKAGVAGRVKLVYAEAGDSAAAVTAAHGGLVVLSLDGKMAVTLPVSDAVSVGSDVTVTLSDGSTKDGTVSEYTADGMVVTLTDNGPVFGDTVTVATPEGVSLGSGTLYIHTPLTITGYTGTVSSVKVKENEKVSASTVLLKLSELGHTAEYDALLAQREDLARQMQSLTALYQNNTITAPFDGTVRSVASDSSDAAATDSSVSAYADELSGLTGFSMPTVSSGIRLQSAPNASGTSEPPAQTSEQPVQPAQPVQTEGTASLPLSAVINLSGGQIADYAGQFTLSLTGDSVQQQKTNDAGGIVSFDPLVFRQAGVYLYQLTQIPGTDSGVQYDTTVYMLLVQVSAGADGKLSASVLPDVRTLVFTNTVGGQTPAQDPTSGNTPSIVIPGDLGALGNLGGLSNVGGLTGGSGVDMSGLGSLSGLGSMGSIGSIGGIDTSGFSSDSLSQTASSGNGDETTVLTLSPNDHMTVQVTVDELDILSVSKGQAASVSIDALGGTTVTGTVTGIDTSGSASGGVTKYTVEVTVDKTEQMLSNMNASVEIVISEAEHCLLIPEAALNQSGVSTFVYVSCDEVTGELSEMREVTTGLSDGTNVEIVSGLSEGETVYYEYNDAGAFPYYNFSAGGRMGGPQ